MCCWAGSQTSQTTLLAVKNVSVDDGVHFFIGLHLQYTLLELRIKKEIVHCALDHVSSSSQYERFASILYWIQKGTRD